MSIWTHVNGSIRIDDMRFGSKSRVEKIKEVLGPILNWDAIWDQDGAEELTTSLPTGSEGSLEYSIYENPHESSLAAYVVSIWGDLRSYDDIDEIKAWFEKVLGSFMVRQAVLEVEVEYGPHKVFIYQDQENRGKRLVYGEVNEIARISDKSFPEKDKLLRQEGYNQAMKELKDSLKSAIPHPKSPEDESK